MKKEQQHCENVLRNHAKKTICVVKNEPLVMTKKCEKTNLLQVNTAAPKVKIKQTSFFGNV
jgi:hypothetical protein